MSSLLLPIVLFLLPSAPASPAASAPTLISVQRLTSEVNGMKDAMQRLAGAADVELVAAAVTGDGRSGVASRDRLAYQLLALGYSAKETADIVAGRISKQALDDAHAMRMAGRGRDAAADYLDARYHRTTLTLASASPIPDTAWLSTLPKASGTTVKPPRAVVAVPTPPTHVSPGTTVGAGKPAARPLITDAAIEAAITRYARANAVDPALVRAIIRTESAFATSAQSPVGAIGLMQLMPATARALGVNPYIAEENVEGGVRYLAGLLRMFGGVELALIAYNAGPGLAQRYARGEVALYGETRDYVRDVMAQLVPRR